MPTTQLSLGVPATILAGTTYALPRVTCNVSAQGGTIEVSNDGSTWAALSGTTTSAMFIRSTGANSLVTVTRAGSSSMASTNQANVFTSAQTMPSISAPAGADFTINGQTGKAIKLVIPPSMQYNFDAAAFYPTENNLRHLGAAANRWNTLYLGGTLQLFELAFASLPASPTVGTLANVSDSNTATIGGTVAGGGANHVLARWNGTIWKVVA